MKVSRALLPRSIRIRILVLTFKRDHASFVGIPLMEPSQNFGAKVWLVFHPLLLSFLKVSQTLFDFFHCVFVNLSQKKMDLVIANIFSNLPVPYVSNPTFFILSWIRVLTTLLILSLCFQTNFCLKMELCYSSMLMIYMC